MPISVPKKPRYKTSFITNKTQCKMMFAPLNSTMQTSSARSPKESTNQLLNHVVTTLEFYANYHPFNLHPDCDISSNPK